MRMMSIAAMPVALFLPSRSKHVTIGKLALIGMLFTTFFLFTAGYVFPGGAAHYPDWAEAIMHGTKLPPTVAQREVVFPLLYILGGFTFTHSFIGLTLILAAFAVLMSILVYWSLESVSPTLAFYMGLACIISLAPFTYIKFFYPDQAYMFFNLLACTFLIKFIQSKGNIKFLYFFTFAALAVSFTRTAGNLIYPVLLTIAYITTRGNLRHYLGCILVFALATSLYQWHRYDIFDMRNHPIKPSGKGMQTIYPIYLYFSDFGIRLSPDIGPNTKRLAERLREEFGSNVRNSAFMKRSLPNTPLEFKEKYIYSYTPDQLVEKIFTEPNEEYYCMILDIAGDDDQFLLDVAKEIARAHPWYIVQFSTRNLWHALFDPGYAVTRYNAEGYIHTGKEFVPAAPSWGVESADSVSQYGQRASKEMEYFPVKSAPHFINKLFYGVRIFHLNNYDRYLLITSAFMLIAWLGACLGLLSGMFSQKKFFQAIREMGIDKLTGPIIAATTIVVYEDVVTSVFCQPVYRYFHLTEPLRLVIAGFGLAFVVSVISWLAMRSRTGDAKPVRSYASAIQKYDVFETYFSQRRTQWILLLLGLNVILFAWWVCSMIAHTT